MFIERNFFQFVANMFAQTQVIAKVQFIFAPRDLFAAKIQVQEVFNDSFPATHGCMDLGAWID